MAEVTRLRAATQALSLERDELEAKLRDRAVELAALRKTLGLTHDVALAIAESEAFEPALEVVLRKVCEATGWVFGQAWVPTDDGSELKWGGAWCSEERLDDFKKTSQSLAFVRGHGLPGRVWETKEPAWIEDVTLDSNFPRAPAARKVGFAAGMAVPVLTGAEVAAVLEFFVFEAREEDRCLLAVVSTVAAQLGSLVLRKAVEESLRASEEKFRALAETATDAIVSADDRGEITYFNRAAELIFGYSSSEVMAEQLTLLMPKRLRQAHRRGFARYLATGEAHVIGKTLELVGARKDGSEFPLELSVASFKARNHQIFFTGIIRDITPRKLAEEALRERGRQLAEAQRVASIGSWEWDVAADKITWSEELYRICNLPPHGFDGSYMAFLSLIHPDDRSMVDEAVRRTLVSGEPFEFDHRIVTPDGERILHSWGQVAMGQGGSPLRMFGISQDITDRYAMDKMKDEFVSVVSHELRTPLTSIRGALGLLAGGRFGSLTEESHRMVEIAQRNADRLVRLLNDILDIERMDLGKVTMNKQSCNAAALMAQAGEEMDGIARAAHVSLSIDPIHARLWADPDRILQALTNLLSNAIKFSCPEGRVWLSARRHRDEVLFQVKDEGRGIPQDKLEKVFGRFQQVDSSDSRQKGGTGLGLAICENIVMQHGGRIWVESVEGRGSTFFFTLPALSSNRQDTA